MSISFFSQIYAFPLYPNYQTDSFHPLAGENDSNVPGEGSPAGQTFFDLCSSGGLDLTKAGAMTDRPPLLLFGPGGDFVSPLDIQIR